MREKILIIGGKTQAKSLAESLLLKKYYVSIISNDPIFCARLAEIDKLNVIYGDGSKIQVLQDADANLYDIAITMYDHDADNLVVCELCKKVFGVKKTVAVVSDAKRTDLFYRVGVDSVVCATSAVSSIIEQQTVLDEINHVIPTTDGRIRISEIIVDDNSVMVGKMLKDIKLPKEAIIGCVIRGNENIIPSGITQICAHDTLLLIASAESEEGAIKIITGR